MSIFKNIRVYRKLLGFTQEEFALMLGISQIYLSHIETNRKPLLEDIADSIAHVLNSIVASIVYHEANLKNADEPDPNLLDKKNPESLRVGHNISKYSPEVQYKALEKMNVILINQYQLDYMLECGKEPPEEVSHSIGQQLISAESPEIIINEVLKLSSSKEVLKAKKAGAKQEVKLRNMKANQTFRS